eukprot:1827746-Alexandrium_andersonii.AAC.1
MTEMLRARKLRLRKASPNARMAHGAQRGIGVCQNKKPLALNAKASQHLNGHVPPSQNSPVTMPRVESAQGARKH